MPAPRSHLLATLAALSALLAGPLRAGAEARPATVSEKEEVVNDGVPAAAAPLDLSTPKRAWSALVSACRAGKPEVGMHALNLGDVPAAERAALGATLARQLCEVLAASGKLTEAADLDDTPTGPLLGATPVNYVVPFRVDAPGGTEELWLRRTHDTKTSEHVWVATRYSVSLIPGWYQLVVKKDRSTRPDADRLNEGLGPLPADWKISTPRGAVAQFLALTSAGSYADAGRLLDLTALPADRQASESARLARRLGLVLERLRPAGFGLLSNDPRGAPESDIPIDEEVIAAATVDGQAETLRMARYARASGKGAWLFAPDTVASIDAVYQHVGYGWLGDHLPPFFFRVQLWNVQLWQWGGLAVVALLALIIGYLAALLARALLRRLTRMTRWEWDDQLVLVVREPLTLLLGALAFAAGLDVVALAERPEQVALAATKLAAIVAIGWLGIRLIDVAADAMVHLFKGRHDELATAMVPVFRKVLKPIAAVIVFIVALQNIGMNVAGLLAGLGIGGVAIALAGKSTLENLFGSLAIAFDRPFKIGDYIKVGEFTGTIEDVGLRSTRIRTLDRTLVTIPNGQMADAKVENFALRDRMRLATTIGVEYGTTLEQLQLVVDEFNRYLVAHPRVVDGFTVRFIGYGATALQIEIFAYVATSDWNTFTGVRQEILMELGQIMRRVGVTLAFPSQTIHLAREGATSGEKAQEAAAIVAGRKAAGELSLVEIPPAVREQLRKRGA